MGAFAGGIVKYVNGKKVALQRTVSSSIVELCTRVLDRTAVDTGALKANWQPSIDQPIETAIEATDREGGQTLLYVYVVAQRAAGHKFYLANNLPYAQKIEDYGGRLKAPGMVGNSALEWPEIVSKAAAQNNV